MEGKKLIANIWDIGKLALIALLIVMPIRIFIFQPFVVNGQSMEPNYHSSDYLIIDEISYRFNAPQRGDVVVFKYPKNPNFKYIKRIIGLPGDRIKISAGDVYLNGQKLDQTSFLSSDVKTNGGAFLGEGDEVVVPEDNYFAMGDNRPFSSDSREWGFVPKNAVIGKSFIVYWPLNRLRIVKHASF